MVKSGDYHTISDLDPGNIPLISCADFNNGVVGNFSFPDNKIYRNSITVAYNGLPLTSKYHPYDFGTKDDVAILIPRISMQDKTMFYVAALLNRLRWQYSYSRKCYRDKLRNVVITIPVKNRNGGEWIDEQIIADYIHRDFKSYIPKKYNIDDKEVPKINWSLFNILDIFELSRGDFHSIDALDQGLFMTVSRVTDNNGVVGYYDRPQGSNLYKSGTLTISTVGGDAFVQLDNFIVTDNVIICIPKQKLRITTLFFLAYMFNQEKWRFSYGRQCYLAKLSRANIYIPVTKDGTIDEDIMQQFVKMTPYWPHISRRF